MADDQSMDEQEDMRELSVVYEIPDMEVAIVRPDITYKTVAEGDLRMDVYYPADYEGETRLPAVVFVHGDAAPENIQNAKDWGQYVSWGQLVAASGLIGITFNHRSSEMPTKLYDAAKDVDDLVAYIRTNDSSLGIDANALCIWTCSGGTPFALRTALQERASYIHCIVSYYGIADLKVYYDTDKALANVTDEVLNEFSAPHRLSTLSGPFAPMLIVRAGRDTTALNASIERLLSAAIAKNVSLDFINHADGQHAFDVLDDTLRSHEIIRATLDFMRTHLLGR